MVVIFCRFRVSDNARKNRDTRLSTLWAKPKRPGQVHEHRCRGRVVTTVIQKHERSLTSYLGKNQVNVSSSMSLIKFVSNFYNQKIIFT